MTTPTDTLRAALEAGITPLPWFVHETLGNAVCAVARTRVCSDSAPVPSAVSTDAAYIAAACNAAPELLREVDRLSGVIRSLNGKCDHLGMTVGAIKDERDALRAEVERRTAAVIVHDGQALACSASVAAAYGTLRAEVERLRADAERYRWLRARVYGSRALGSARPASFGFPSAIELPPVRGDIMRGSVAEHLDHAIDAALQEKTA